MSIPFAKRPPGNAFALRAVATYDLYSLHRITFEPFMMMNSPASSRKPAKNTKAATAVPKTPPVTTSKQTPAVKAAVASEPVRSEPVAKAKLVRDSFTIPKPEYENLADLKRRALALGIAAKKSELIRAGIAAMTAMNDRAFLAAVRSVPNLKTGRPKGPSA